MIFQFPLVHEDELLVSALARFATRYGLRDDKVALEALFGSRNIVPSAILQGHIKALLTEIAHMWPKQAEEIIADHSVLPFFESFVEPSRILEVNNSLIHSNKSNVMTRIGVNASSTKWPRYYRYCPDCLAEDQSSLAYSYWRRTFQLPGVLVCPIHCCYLLNSPYKLLPQRRHKLWDASLLLPQQALSPMYVQKGCKLLKLSVAMKQLLGTQTPYVTPGQWTFYYHRLIKSRGLMNGNRVNHAKIRELVVGYWGMSFLEDQCLGLNSENNWLLSFFRKHRRHYSALQHFICLMALCPSISPLQAIKDASAAPAMNKTKKVYKNSRAKERVSDYRMEWSALCSKFRLLKDIRLTREGSRLYSWLYRFDNKWLMANLPARSRNDMGRQINWCRRDIQLVRKLIRIRDENYEKSNIPRMTQTWFIATANVSWGVCSHLEKLPLCKSFFIKYTESVDEYQVRRILDIMLDHISKGKPLPKTYEIERIAGLSKKRSREPVKQILRMDFEKFSIFNEATRGC